MLEAVNALLDNNALLTTVCISFVAVVVLGIDIFKEPQTRKVLDHRGHLYAEEYLDANSLTPRK